MNSKRKNSKRRFKKYIEEKGILSYWRKDKRKEKAPSADKDVRKPLRYYLRRYFEEFREEKGRLLLVIGVGIACILLELAIPWTSKIMIDYVLPKKDVALLLWVCAGLFAILSVRYALSVYRDYSDTILTGRFVTNLQQRLMRHLLTLPLVELQKLKVGGVVSRLQDDSSGAGQLVFSGLLTPFNAGLMFILSMASLLMVSWKIAIICIFFCLLMCTVAYLFFYVMRPFQRDLQEDQAVMRAGVTESFGGIQVVRGFGRERAVRSNYAFDNNLYWRKGHYIHVVTMLVNRSVYGIHFVSEVSIWLIGGYYYINGSLSLGSLVVFISFLGWIFQPIFMIMSSFSETQKNLACAERTIDLLDMEPDIVDKDGAVMISGIAEGLKFNSISFKYPDGTLAIDGVDLHIPKGKVTALVGPSGGGKTTLTNLVMRFYDVSSGSIDLDGTDIRDIRISSYRKLFSLVLQDVFLFDGTVRENILFGRRDASPDELEKAAKVAHCHEFVEKLSDGYETIIGERGVKLSGGQKQRIALARAIIANPQLLILDEATSNLDSESEGLIQDALQHIFKDRTSIVIAHRLSTIMDADKIVVIDNGKLVEEGRHEDLLAKRDKYYDMYTKQMERAKNIENIWNNAADPQNGTQT